MMNENKSASLNIEELESLIQTEQQKLAEGYSQLGIAYYDLHKFYPEDGLRKYVLEVSEGQTRIAMLKEQLQQAKSLTIYQCINCKAPVESGSHICNHCMRRQIWCPNCNHPMPDDHFFCVHCGQQIQERPQPVHQMLNQSPYARPDETTDTYSAYSGEADDMQNAWQPEQQESDEPVGETKPVNTGGHPDYDAEYDAVDKSIRRCPSCGESLSPTARFCTECGLKL